MRNKYSHKILFWVLYYIFITSKYGLESMLLTGPLFQSFSIVCCSIVFNFIAVRILEKAKKQTSYLWRMLLLFITTFLVSTIINDIVLKYSLRHFNYGIHAESMKSMFVFSGQNLFERTLFKIKRLDLLFNVTLWIPLFFKIIYDNIKDIQKLKNIEKQNLDFEIGVLKSQINPQFINGALENIKKLAISQPDRAALMVLKLSNATRYTLYETDTDFVPLQKELDFIINCIDLEETRLANQANINFRLKTNQSEYLKIAPMLLFPLIERAFKCIKSNCDIDLLVENSVLNLKIESDKITDCKNEDIEIIKKRLDYVYASKFKLQVIDSERIFKAELRIEL